MSQRRRSWIDMAAALALLAMPAAAMAQSAIAGGVTDTTGAVLPGVTVEARSPALIEQVRTAVTDAQGQYRVVDLRPGLYTVTFSLTGFTTVVRRGIQLEPNFTAPVNVQMQVGSLEETLTVLGGSPVVDVQTTQRRAVVSQELIQALPTGRSRETIMATLPAVTTTQFDVGGASQMSNGTAAAYGGTSRHQDVTIDGMSISSMAGDGSTTGAYLDIGPVQEYVVQVSGGGAEIQTGGVQINMVPRAGSNTFSGQFVGLFSGQALKSNNISDALRASGVPASPKIARAFDVNGFVGGPIRQNRLWYFVSARAWSFDTEVFNLFHDGAIKPKGTPVVDENLLQAIHGRLTAQLSPRNKLTVMNERDWKDALYMNVARGTAAPESLTHQTSPLTDIAQAKWTSTVTNKLLLEAGWSFNYYTQFNAWPDGLPKNTPENPYASLSKVDLKDNITFGAPPGPDGTAERDEPSFKNWFTGSVAYVTGTHALRGGLQFQSGRIKRNNLDLLAMQQRYLNGVPNSVTLFNWPTRVEEELAADLGLYVQYSWKRDRLTINPGLRYDYLHGEIPEQSAEAGFWVPARSYPAMHNVPLWKDVTPRLGVAYDLLGTSKTVIKGSVGTYLAKNYTGIADRYNPMFNDRDTRNWSDLNGDGIAQLAELGPPTNLSFGVRANRVMDPDLRRERNTLYNVSFENELHTGVGLSVAFNRRTYTRLGWTDNLDTTFDDYTLLSVPDPRSNGQTLPVYNLSRAKLGLVHQIDATSNSNMSFYNGFDINLQGHLPNGAQFLGGTSSGHTITKMCQVDDPNQLRFCDQSKYHMPFGTILKVSGTYPLPRGLRLSAVFQSLPGTERAITYPVTRTLLPALTVSSISVQLNEPGSEFRPRVNQLDISLAGTFSPTDRIRLRPAVDVFNALNSSPVLAENNVFGTSLGRPRQVLFARFVRLGMRVDF